MREHTTIKRGLIHRPKCKASLLKNNPRAMVLFYHSPGKYERGKTMANFKWYKVKVVQEKGERYNVDRKISGPYDIHRIARDVLEMDTEAEEVVTMLTLDTKNQVTGIFEVSRGTINSSLVHPREVFKRALLHNATSIILLHNHPSGDPKPSTEDVNMTKRIVEAGSILGVNVLDHVIIGHDRHASLKEMELM